MWKNGIWKEYDNNILIYKAEFLNEKRHGKGKEYYDSKEMHKLTKINKL